MIATNPIPDVCNYAQCGEKCAPTPEQAAAGLVPLSTIPAQRWNSLWNAANQSVNCLKSAAGALIDEINSVLTATGITPDPTCTDQLYRAIDCIRAALGTDQAAGSVKSSSVAGQVSIDTNGIMTANCVGNATQLTTACKELTGAVNELKTTYDNAFIQVWGNAAWITGCRADVCHSSDALTYGGGTSSLYGHVKLSDTYDSCVGNAASSVAASQLTLYCLMQAVENMSGLSNYTARDFDPFAQTGTAGTSPQAARSDHVHQLNCDYWPYTTAIEATYRAQCPFTYDRSWLWYAPYQNTGSHIDRSIWPLIICTCSSGWFDATYHPRSCIRGYFRGCNVGDFLTPWFFDCYYPSCYPGCEYEGRAWCGPTYKCWECVRCCTGVEWCVCWGSGNTTGGYNSQGTNSSGWQWYSAVGTDCLFCKPTAGGSGAGDCIPSSLSKSVYRPIIWNQNSPVFTTSVFQVIYPRVNTCSNANIYMRCYAHALIWPTNEGNDRPYLTFFTTSECVGYYGRSRANNGRPYSWSEPMWRPYLQDVLAYTCPAVGYYNCSGSAYITYAMDAVAYAIGLCNEVLYVR